jgi:hypothetical protein
MCELCSSDTKPDFGWFERFRGRTDATLSTAAVPATSSQFAGVRLSDVAAHALGEAAERASKLDISI